MNSGAQLSGEASLYNFDEHYAPFVNAAESISDEGSLMKLNAKDPTVNSINVPMGWNRIFDNGAVVYISPNKSRLRSMDDVRQYIMSASTCKCGLECPFHLEKVFSFSTSVATKQMLQKLSNTHPTCYQCRVDDGFQKLLLQFTSEKIAKLVKKGSKKKRKRPKNFEKEGKKRLIRKGQKPNDIVSQPWMNSVIIKDGSAAYSSANMMIEDEMGSLIHCPKNPIGSYSQNIDLIDHLTSTNVQSSINGDLLSTQREIPDKSTVASSMSSPPASTLKTATLKTTGKKGLPKSKRIPKSKEDLTIASMMGRVKQQVGDLDRIRTSQMFTQTYQTVSRHDGRSANVGDKKTTVHVQNTQAPTTTNQSSEYNKSSAVLNLIETKGPPNVTLPLSHSNMLPKVVVKSLEYPTTSSMQSSTQITAVSRSPGSQFEPQTLAMRQDSNLFSAKASTNVYWGRDEQLSSKDTLQPPGMKHGACANSRSGTPSEATVSEKNRGFEIAKEALSNKSSLVIAEGSSKSDYAGQLSGQNLIKETNAPHISVNDNSVPANASNMSSRARDGNHFVFNNANLSRQNLARQTLSAEAAHKASVYPIDKPLANDLSGATKGVLNKGVHGIDENVVIEQDVRGVRTTDTLSTVPTSLKGDSLSVATSSSITVNKSPKGIPAKFPGSLKESISSKPLQTQSAINATTASVSTTSQPQQPPQLPQPQQPEVVSFQNLYGISNPTHILKGAVAACKSNSAGTNPARFLIMGSQASQALQHLALQQSNTLQVSLQRTENSQAMYLQTLASYNPTSLNPSHGNIGFAYANVPIQLMTLGGPQVVGKQQQAQTFNVDRYSNFYRYYQGSRQFEGTTNDLSSQVQATSLMFPGVNPATQATGSYIRIAPASPATSKIPLPLPVLPTQSQPGQSVLEETHQQQILSSSSTQTGLNPTSSASVSNVNLSNSTSSREIAHDLAAELKRKPAGCEEILNAKGKQPCEDSVSVQVSVVPPQPNSVAPPQPGSTVPMKAIQEQVLSQKRALQSPEVNSRPQAIQQSNGTGTFTTSVENRDTSKISGIASKDVIRELGSDVKASSALQSPVAAVNTSVRQLDGGLNINAIESSIRNEEQEELNLKCNEPCNNGSDDSRAPTPETNSKAPVKFANQQEPNASMSLCRGELKVGDLIWGHQKGYSAWPGKIVSALEVKESSTENGKVWIQWFGEHTHSQMELNSLKSLQEGLDEYRNSKRRKNRSNKKTIESLESAIAEALDIANSRSITSSLPSNTSDLESEAKKPRT